MLLLALEREMCIRAMMVLTNPLGLSAVFLPNKESQHLSRIYYFSSPEEANMLLKIPTIRIIPLGVKESLEGP